MTQDEIMEMAKEAHIGFVFPASQKALERFAKLVAAKEREAVIQHLIKLKILSWDAGLIDLIRTRGKA